MKCVCAFKELGARLYRDKPCMSHSHRVIMLRSSQRLLAAPLIFKGTARQT